MNATFGRSRRAPARTRLYHSGLMHDLLKDLRFAARALAKSPALSLAALVALALGIGANTAIFSVVNTVLIEPMPYPDPERLVLLLDANPEAGVPRFSASPPNFADWRAQSRSFEGMAAFTRASLSLTGDAEPERIDGVRATAGFFATLGVEPALGRGFRPAEDRPGGDKVVVLGHELWQRRYAGDRSVLGSAIRIDGEPHTVVGIMPERFSFPREMELWLPLALAITPEQRGGHWLGVVARLEEGVAIERAQAEMQSIAQRLEQQYPESNTGWTVNVHGLHDIAVEKIRPALLVLLVTVGCVLLIACADVANLLLARMAAREREVAIRTALGAGRSRLVRQFLTESVLLAVGGGALGLLLAYAGTQALIAFNPDNVPRVSEIRIDLAVLAFTLVLAVVTGLVFGLLPALHAFRHDLQGALKEGSRAVTAGGAGGAGGRARFARSALVLAEVAVALVLLIGAGLLLRSFRGLQRVSPGFPPEGVLTVDLTLPESKYAGEPQVAAFYRDLVTELRAIPGVERAGAGFPLPLSGRNFILALVLEGKPEPPPGQEPSTNVRFVTPGYLETLAIPRRRGRSIRDSDVAGAPRVVVVNETMAASLWPDEEPIGRRFTFGDPEDPEDPGWMTVVGIVGDVRHATLDAVPENETYVPIEQAPFGAASIVVRSAGDPMDLAGAVRVAVRRIDPELPLGTIETVEQVVAASLNQHRFNTTLVGTFAALALVLAVVGVYGVISYGVSQRVHEMGLRMALGAGRAEVRGMVVRQGMAVVLAGVAVGLAAAFAATRLLQAFLYGIRATDPLTFVVVPAVLALAALVASWLPAHRATRVEPMVALRTE